MQKNENEAPAQKPVTVQGLVDTGTVKQKPSPPMESNGRRRASLAKRQDPPKGKQATVHDGWSKPKRTSQGSGEEERISKRGGPSRGQQKHARDNNSSGRQRRRNEEKPLVVPRILMRPDRAVSADAPSSATTPNEQQPVAISSATNSAAPASQNSVRGTQIQTQTQTQAQPKSKVPTPAGGLSLARLTPARFEDSGAYKRATQHVRDHRLALISPAGKLNDSGARRTLGHLRSRTCVGVVGRASAGKSMLMSVLAQPPLGSQSASAMFPLAGAAEAVCTLGVDLWATESRAILVDTPPVLDLHSADAWLRSRGLDSAMSSRLVVSKTHDLQIASLLLQTCDTLVVLVGERKRRGKGAQTMYEMYMDRGLARLLAAAASLSQTIPGLSRPAEPHNKTPQDRRCRLHVVVNQGMASLGCQRLDLDPAAIRDIKDAYEHETGIAVSGVSFLPTRAEPEEASDPTEFADIAGAWDAQRNDQPSDHQSVLPLYAPADRHRSKRAAAKPQGTSNADSLVLSPWEPSHQPHRKQVQRNVAAKEFASSVNRLRTDLLAATTSSSERGGSDLEGAWLAGCLRSWDSIRRSDALHRAAAMREDDAVDIVESAKRYHRPASASASVSASASAAVPLSIKRGSSSRKAYF
ncbi:hypothetical protein H4S06_001645 [Coemansia sp. BCRC 34490]|nr:hypothetical protein H4S06_001645 [Coemansia sp. BCRC 34490]